MLLPTILAWWFYPELWPNSSSNWISFKNLKSSLCGGCAKPAEMTKWWTAAHASAWRDLDTYDALWRWCSAETKANTEQSFLTLSHFLALSPRHPVSLQEAFYLLLGWFLTVFPDFLLSTELPTTVYRGRICMTRILPMSASCLEVEQGVGLKNLPDFHLFLIVNSLKWACQEVWFHPSKREPGWVHSFQSF